MLISELPVGSRLIFGCNQDDRDYEWIKVSDDNDFVTALRRSLVYDACEWHSVTRDHKNNGNNFFPISNICQYLNSRGNDWFRPSHEFDMLHSSMIGRPGFMSCFSDQELRYIVPRKITFSTPRGCIKRFGKKCEYTLKVTLPSFTEILFRPGAGDDESEKHLPFLSMALDAMKYSGLVFTRTPYDGGSTSVCAYNADHNNYMAAMPRSRCDICPMIRLAPDMSVQSDRVIHGLYYQQDAVQESLGRIIFA